MTCIVGIERDGVVWVGGDSCAIGSDMDFCMVKSPKAWVRNTMVFGCSGGFREQQILQYDLEIPEHPGGMSAEAYLCTIFVSAVRSVFRSSGAMTVKEGVEELANFATILGYMGQLYVLEPNFGVLHSTRGYEAIGSGAKYALGSLWTTLQGPATLSAESQIRCALSAAAEHNAGVMRPFTVVEGGRRP